MRVTSVASEVAWRIPLGGLRRPQTTSSRTRGCVCALLGVSVAGLFGLASPLRAQERLDTLGRATPDSEPAEVLTSPLSTGRWSIQATLSPDDLNFNATYFFGYSVSIDGDTAIVGDIHNENALGAAYFYRAIDGKWRRIGKVAPPGIETGGWFGYSSSISGNTAVVGVLLGGPKKEQGSAYVSREVDGEWLLMSKLTSPDASPFDWFGGSVSVDAGTVVVGCLQDDELGVDSGAAFVFREVDGEWRQISKLKAADANGGDLFGSSVAIDGDTIVVGASYANEGHFDSGAAYVFREINGAWRQIKKLVAPDGAESDHFGNSIAIHETTVVIGAKGDDEGAYSAGSAYVFREFDDAWRQIAKLTPTDPTHAEHFGDSVSVGDHVVIVGAEGKSAAYVFEELNDGVWSLVASFYGGAQDHLGAGVSISGDVAIIGAPHAENEVNHQVGVAYVLERASICVADVNRDGALNILDFVAFQQLFVAGDLGADCDGNGAFNVLDFTCYQHLFELGCP